MSAIITFIIVFGVIVTVHEFGHFYMAKRSGILVREFAIGMGPKLVNFKKNGTTYTLRLLPLGGYVRMAGTQDDDDEIKPGTPASIAINDQNVVERINISKKNPYVNDLPVQIVKADLVDKLEIVVYENGDESQEKTYHVDHDATIVEEDGTEVLIAPRDVQFQSASLLNRILTNFAGPFNNMILSIVAYLLVAFMLGGIPEAHTDTNQVNIAPDSAIQKAGVKQNDRILEVNGKKTSTYNQVQKAVASNKKKQVELVVKHKDNVRQIKVTPQKQKNSDKKLIGISPKTTVDRSFGAKLKYGFTQPFVIVATIIGILGNMFTTGFDLNQFGGPVAIYSLTSQVSTQGIISIISFIGMLSINLGFMNLLPIPALDGGKLLLNFVEGIRGKPISEEKEGIVNLIGVAILVTLMIAVTWNDIQRFFIH
ncbi:RIP metalloprotease RseP [Lactobacillus sp. YT155]|uniref:RIP metalloprotease RseP n=1 Tax=Lactobacillus sp. YT155 TaxID=3060955 RepID=UPI00265E3549|nr:RIP metalloprotease RseP [Lactobacillus sp. YT155]MDO1605514.1 RIP metalloprotease RseP [Lactobacillus sp. YT155]